MLTNSLRRATRSLRACYRFFEGSEGIPKRKQK
jgi:hypothetical protein